MVYVDTMKARLGRMTMCHMIADTAEELHLMAARIGVKRRWYQGDHYDICQSMKKKAIAFGATEISMRDLCLMNARRHRAKDDTVPLMTPEEGRRYVAEGLRATQVG